MEVKVILAAVSLSFGGILLVMGSVMARSTGFVDTQIQQSSPNWTQASDKRYKNNYNGVQVANFVAIGCAVVHIVAFVMVCVKDDLWLQWADVHFVTSILALSAGIVATIFQAYAFVPALGSSIQKATVTNEKGWSNLFGQGYWGTGFIVVAAIDAIFSAGCAVGTIIVTLMED